MTSHSNPAHFRAYGVVFSIACSGLLETVIPWLPYGTEATSSATPGAELFLLSSDGDGASLTVGDTCIHGAELDSILDELRRRLMILIASRCQDFIFVHAGVVTIDGQALMLPGFSFAGKTTLVAALVRAGALYYSDEYAVIDPQGYVHPYARALQMRQPGSELQTSVSASSLNGRTGIEPVPVRWIAFTRFQPDADWDPQPLSPAMAVLEMLRHTITTRRRPADTMATLSALFPAAQAFRTDRGDAPKTAQTLLALMRRREFL